MTLTDFAAGSPVRIVNTDGVSETVRRRLIDMGIMEGTVVSLKKALPFGGPLTLEAHGQWVAIRRKEAIAIQVEAI